MSRIYEALERAEIERGNASSPESEEVGSSLLVLADELPSVKTNELFEETPRHSWHPSMVTLPTLTESGVAVEQFRSLRSSIYQLRDQISLKTMVVSSGMPAEGKTFVAANLAISLARNNDHPVLLIDADLRRPSIHRLLGAPDGPGLTQYLAGTATAAEVMQRAGEVALTNGHGAHAISNIAFIPAGQGCDNSPELVGNHRMEELIAAVSPHFAWIIIDSPPVLVVTDAVDLARAAEGVLLVARVHATTYDVAQRAQAAFSNTRVLGFVLNAVKNAPRKSSYYYYRGEDSTDTSARPKTKRS
jgi:capsular exopolysaccharide synthesis family protein